MLGVYELIATPTPWAFFPSVLFLKKKTKQKLIGHMQNHARRFYMIRVNHAMMARYKAKANKIRLKKDLLSSHRNYLHRNLYMPF
jgi:hypothetical protein